MRTLAIVQARTNSSRLPGKVLQTLGNVPMIIFQLRRISKSKRINKIILATSDCESDNELARVVQKEGVSLFRGSLNDVLKRYWDCAKDQPYDAIVRLTGDCPFSDPQLIDEIVEEFSKDEFDYISNCSDDNQLSVPDGFDIEIFRLSALKQAHQNAKLDYQREHVTPWMRSKESNLLWKHYRHSPIRTYYRVTVDDPVDWHQQNLDHNPTHYSSL